LECGIYFLWTKKYGWAVGGSSDFWDMGIILKTIDGGETWQVNKHPAGIIGNAVYFTDSSHGIIVGFNPFSGGLVRITSDGGESWESPGVFNSWLNDVVFTDDSTGWVVGDYGFIWYTEDSGKTWEQVESGTSADLNRIVFVEDGKVGYIFGENNILLRYDRTGSNIKEEDVIISSIFKLYQNYPNPFNSSTALKYNLRESDNVILKVYNLTGKEVITLVDENQIPGSYKAVWNGKDQSGRNVGSGIYVSVFQVDNITISRKVILLR